jgi:glycosyltransferase involved in cell wall biosynthesis
VNPQYWFISQFYWPVENSTGHIITRIIDVFTSEHKANIITVGHKNIIERNDNIAAIRVMDMKLNKNILPLRLLKLFFISFEMAIIVFHSAKKQDVVVAVTNPAPLLVLLAFFKNILKIRLIIIVHDVFPENLIVAGITKQKSLLYKVVKKIFDWAYDQAELLITCGRDMQKTIMEKVKNKDKVIFIPNFDDTDILYHINKEENQIVKNLQIHGKMIVLFTGNIGRMQNIDNLIMTAELLKDEPSIVFLFIGEGAYQDKIKNYMQAHRNIFLIPNMHRQDALVFLNAGDIGISTLLPNIMGVGVPSKTYSYMATGKPVIAVMDQDSEIAMMIKEESNGWIVEPDNPGQLASLLRYLKSNPEVIMEKGEISHNLSITKYAVKNVTKKYVEAILTI